MIIKVKKLNEKAVLPTKAHASDAGFDLTATSKTIDTNGNVVYGVGLAFEIPQGHVGLLFPRSSNAKKPLLLSNAVGVLDSCYRGEVLFKFKPSIVLDEPDVAYLPEEIYSAAYNVGERIGQIIVVPLPDVEFVEADKLSETERGMGGYGSSGK